MIDGHILQRCRNARTYRVRLSDDDFHLLRIAAARHNQAPNQLLNKLIEILLHEKLIDAVLDDKTGR